MLSQDTLSEQWGKKPVYVMGGATGSAVQSLGLSPLGEEIEQAPHYPSKYVSHGNTQTHVSYTLQYTTGFTCALFYCLCAVCTSLVKVKLPSIPNSVHPFRPSLLFPSGKIGKDTLSVKSKGFPLHEVISHET